MGSAAGAVIVTGASGFVGRHTVNALPHGRAVALSLRAGDDCDALLAQCCSGREVSTVIHAGGRAHARDRGRGKASAGEEAHRQDNFELTCSLAQAADSRGIRRFVFVSTISVLATHSEPGKPLRGDEQPSPVSAYGRAKLAAENELFSISAKGQIEVVIVRPTLVYGAGAQGNLARLASAIKAGIPLPLGAVQNRRSMMNVRDLAEFLAILADLEHLPASPLIAADAEPVSTSTLIRQLSQALGRPPRLLPFPVQILRMALRAVGQRNMAGQLLDDFEVDIAPTCAATGWRPKYGLSQGLGAFASAMAKHH